MHVDEVLWHGENRGATWSTSHLGCIMKKVVSKKVTPGGRLYLFLDSINKHPSVILFSISCVLANLSDYFAGTSN